MSAVAMIAVLVVWVVALLATDHFNCKQRSRRLMLSRLKNASAVPVGQWEPVWTMLIPKFLNRKG